VRRLPVFRSLLLALLLGCGCGPDRRPGAGEAGGGRRGETTRSSRAAPRGLAVAAHILAPIPPEKADLAFEQMTAILATDDDGDGPDVACDVLFVREGAIEPFDFPADGQIWTVDEYDRVVALPGTVKVVERIYWCGVEYPGGVAGCGASGKGSFVVVRTADDREGMLWAHEFGHLRGLPDLGDDPNAVMYRVLNGENWRVREPERLRYE
jgi:hypothetical protein